MLVLLGLSSLAAALVPAPEEPAETDSSTTSTSTTSDLPAGGELLRVSVDADARRVERVELPVGDQLALDVRSRRPGEIEIPRLGLLQDVAPGAPARFDILAREPGKLEVRRVASRDRVTVIEVVAGVAGGG